MRPHLDMENFMSVSLIFCIHIQVYTGANLTEKFRINQGVKQGCILSPLLFNIFISDLTKHLGKDGSNPVRIDETMFLNSLIWADDLLLLSESENGLNKMLANLKDYTKSNLIRVNLEKTNYMIFNKGGRLIRRKFMFGDEKVEMATKVCAKSIGTLCKMVG